MIGIELELQKFIDNENVEEGSAQLREKIQTLQQLRQILYIAKHKHPGEYEDVLETLISIS